MWKICANFIKMEKYNFDTVIDRRNTGAIKIEGLKERFGREDVCPMWIADMDFAICPEITAALNERLADPVYGYSKASDGYWQAIIDWLDRRHHLSVTREELSFIPGVVRGVAYAVNYFSSRGDKIIIQPPVYHPFKMVIEGNDRVALPNPLVLTELGYKMDLEHLERLMAEESPRMMILCNPHNPAGIQWDVETLRRVAALARKHNVVVVSDEIHADLMVFGNEHIPFVSVSEDAETVAVTLSAPSKTFNIPGLVSSWMLVKNPELRVPFYRWLSSNEFDGANFMATIGTEAAYRNGERWLGELLTYIEDNIKFVEEFMAQNLPMLKPMRPQASFLVWLDCRGLNLSQPQLVDLFVNKARLALNDGTMFGREGEGFMRLNVACPRVVLADALANLAKAIND